MVSTSPVICVALWRFEYFFHKLSRTLSSCCLLLPLSVIKCWLLRWPLPCFSMSRIAALAWKEIQEMIMGLFSWLITREFICYKGHIDFFVCLLWNFYLSNCPWVYITASAITKFPEHICYYVFFLDSNFFQKVLLFSEGFVKEVRVRDLPVVWSWKLYFKERMVWFEFQQVGEI